MAWFFVALFAAPILATLWAIGFGVMAVREKKLIWRVLCGLQVLAGAVFAAAAWILFGFMSPQGATFFAGVQAELPVITPAGGMFLVAIDVLVLVLVVRQRRTRVQGRL